jgi:hypothetical protein
MAVRQVQVTKEGNYKRRMHACNYFLQVVYDSLLEPQNLHFSIMKLGSI